MKPSFQLLVGVVAMLMFNSSAFRPLSCASMSTTIYVGGHFEVRNHDEPIKYVFNGANRLARVTGSLSPRARVQQLRLYQGWNLISLAVSTTNTLEQLSSSPGGNRAVLAAYVWNPATRIFDSLTNSQALSAGSVLWLKVAEVFVAKIAGIYNEPGVRHVVPDGAWLSGTGLELWSPGLPDSATLWKHRAFDRTWHPTYAGILASPGQPKPIISPGEAIYAHTTEQIQLLPTNPQLRIAYYHEDHLGSSSALTDADGNLIRSGSYFPFGARRYQETVGNLDTYYEFSRKERDAESGLQCFGERYMHSGLGKWISPDPLGEKGGGPNPFAYVDNNPLKLRDPDGSEIVVEEKIKGNTITYHIKLKAVMINTSSTKFDQKQMAAYAAKLKSQIETSYKGSGRGTVERPNEKPKLMNIRWSASVDIRVVSAWNQVEKNDHVFRILDQTKGRASGDTHRGSMLVNLEANIFSRPTPDQFDKVKPIDPRLPWTEFHQPEAVGAHEFGHTAGLPHNNSHLNLMKEGEKQHYLNTKIDQSQIRTIVEAYRNNQLNQRDEVLDSLTKQ